MYWLWYVFIDFKAGSQTLCLLGGAVLSFYKTV